MRIREISATDSKIVALDENGCVWVRYEWMSPAGEVFDWIALDRFPEPTMKPE